jgi:serine/threonine-protein kinase HipA
MATTKKAKTSTTRTLLVYLGDTGLEVGELQFSRQGQKELSAFRYSPAWLSNPDCFALSPDLPLSADFQYRTGSKETSTFAGAIADTEPDGWGRRVINRAHAKRRKAEKDAGRDAGSAQLSDLDYLLGVLDSSRIGALRFRDNANSPFLDVPHDDNLPEGTHEVPLQTLIQASKAVESGKETATDLAYLKGRGTSLGGMRPKATVLKPDGTLTIAKFPSVNDTRDMARGEVLALLLAKEAGLNASEAEVVMAGTQAVALIVRFDRPRAGGRIPYLSAASLLQLDSREDGAYTQIAEAIDRFSPRPLEDKQELWARICFNMLITNVDDHMHNHGFLHSGGGQWRLAPLFDVNPFPDKEPILKTAVTEASGETGDIQEALEAAAYFGVSDDDAHAILTRMAAALTDWKRIARSPAVGMSDDEIEKVTPAFENDNWDRVATFLEQ